MVKNMIDYEAQIKVKHNKNIAIYTIPAQANDSSVNLQKKTLIFQIW